ncbi:oligosaccharide ABC transporter permease [Mycoplasmopsis columbina SF7]|uniref:Oligosaccharide ABC transporter permease n=1 Tax=Mycoplasmopsis columbina SF7 TaxID=1037410 RepID=F9UJY6_9BACT|nr:sugar ABC transporter permease [Mycoplasmopsis columbina]EGV00332.1 oligosaccharide ABC transporter permease [Mycoplasmopsis columbina SF7]
MKLSSKFWAGLSIKIPKLSRFSANQQIKTKAGSLSESIVEKETASYKPLAILLPMIFIIITFTIAPLIFNIKFAFTKEVIINGVAHSQFTFENFNAVLQDPAFAVGFRNSLIYGLIVLPFSIAISLLISSTIANLYAKTAKGFWQTIFFLPYVTNAVAISLTFLQLFQPTGLINSAFGLGKIPWLESQDQFSFKAMVAIISQGIWGQLAFNILIFTTAMLSVDKNQYRSASIDGIGKVKQFFTITLPSIKSTTSFLITLGIINGIKVFPNAIFDNNPTKAIANGGSSLMVYVYRFVKSGNLAYGSAAALCLFGIGVFYSSIIRGGFRVALEVTINKGEHNVWNKIKNSQVMIEYQTQKKQR